MDGTWLLREYGELAGALSGLRGHGLAAPLLAVGDGALGLWSTSGEMFPTTAHQRCWNHRVLSVVLRLSERCRLLNGGRPVMGLLLDGAKFEDVNLTELMG